MANAVDTEELVSRLKRFFSDRPEIAAAMYDAVGIRLDSGRGLRR